MKLNPKDYDIISFRISRNPAKKYDAILKNKETKELKYIPFGSKIHGQYFDKIGYYSNLNNLDVNRKRLYRLRHKNDDIVNYTPGYFSWYYLWD